MAFVAVAGLFGALWLRSLVALLDGAHGALAASLLWGVFLGIVGFVTALAFTWRAWLDPETDDLNIRTGLRRMPQVRRLRDPATRIRARRGLLGWEYVVGRPGEEQLTLTPVLTGGPDPLKTMLAELVRRHPHLAQDERTRTLLGLS